MHVMDQYSKRNVEDNAKYYIMAGMAITPITLLQNDSGFNSGSVYRTNVYLLFFLIIINPFLMKID